MDHQLPSQLEADLERVYTEWSASPPIERERTILTNTGPHK